MAARETWQREACIAAGGRSCLNENIERTYRMSRWSFQSEVSFMHLQEGQQPLFLEQVSMWWTWKGNPWSLSSKFLYNWLSSPTSFFIAKQPWISQGTVVHLKYQLENALKSLMSVYSSSTLQHVQAAELPQQSVHCPCSLSSAGFPDIPPCSAEYKVCWWKMQKFSLRTFRLPTWRSFVLRSQWYVLLRWK